MLWKANLFLHSTSRGGHWPPVVSLLRLGEAAGGAEPRPYKSSKGFGKTVGAPSTPPRIYPGMLYDTAGG